MANTVICAELQDGYDLSCVRNIVKKYHQEAVIINHNDIDFTASTLPDLTTACTYDVPLVLKSGKKGVQIKLPSSGNSIRGWADKSKDDNGIIQYLHSVQIFAAGVSAETKCILDKLDHGNYVVALQTLDGVVEIYGLQNGLSTGDYSYNIAEGGGGSLIPLQSDENAQESYLPLIYLPQSGGDANADFNSQFEQPVTP